MLDSKTTTISFHNCRVVATEFNNIYLSEGIFLLLSLQTLEWSLIDENQMRLLTPLQGQPRYQLVSPLIWIYPLVLILLLLIKCYEHLSFTKMILV